MDFFVVGITREGNWAGSDNELNSYSRPPKRSSLSRCGEASSQVQNTGVISACKRKMHATEKIFSRPTVLVRHSRPRALALPSRFPHTAGDWV